MLKERSLDEIMGILQSFPDSFKERFGRKITKSELIKHLNERLYSQELQQLKTTFDNFTPQALKAVIKTIEQESFDNIEDNLIKSYDGELYIKSVDSHVIAQDLTPKDDTEFLKHKKNKKQWKDIF